VSRDFLLLVFFANQFPPSPRVFHLDRFEFFRKFAEIFASQGAPPVSTTPVANLPPVSATPVANFSTIFTSVVDTGGKFATGVNDTGGKFATGVNDAGGKLPLVSTTPAANNGNNIRLQTP
jgi:hypothetical protein